MKKDIGILLLFLLLGILVAELLGDEFLVTYGFLSEYQLHSFGTANIDRMNLFWNVLWERGKGMLVIALISATPLRGMLPRVGEGILGFVLGFFASVCVLQMGFLGILVVFAALLPHGAVYLIALILLYQLKPTYTSEGRKRKAGFFLRILVIWMLFLVACLMETYIGTGLLQMIIRRVTG